MDRITTDFLWRNVPRVICVGVFLLSIYSKLMHEDIFFTMTSSFGLSLPKAEIIYSLLISLELILIILLVFKPMPGILSSAILLILYSLIITYLHFEDYGSVYGCFGDVNSSEISFTKILQNIGLALLLISSWWLRKDKEVGL